MPLNLDLGISSQQGWVFLHNNLFVHGFNPITFDKFENNFMFNPLVSGSSMLSLDLMPSIEITLVESSCRMVLCLRRMCRDLPLYIALYARPIADWLSQWIEITETGLGQPGISSKKFHSHSASSPLLSSAINSDSMVDPTIIVCFQDVHDIDPPPSVNKTLLVDSESLMSDI